jgi:hypothetical protein
VVRRTFLRSGEAWAGAGAPFRSAAERDSLLALYTMVSGTDEEAGELVARGDAAPALAAPRGATGFRR